MRASWLLFSAALLAPAVPDAQDLPVRALVSELIAARTDAERDALLARDPKKVTPELARALIAHGDERRLRGDYSSAQEAYSLARSVAGRTGDRLVLAKALNETGVLRYYQGDFDQASDLFRRSLALREAIGDKAGIAASLTNFGLLHHSLGDYELSLEYQLKSLDLRQSLGDRAAVAQSQTNIGIVHHRRGNYGEALRYYRMALVEFEARGDQARAAIVLNNIGNALELENSLELALDYLKRSLRLREALGDKNGVVGTLNNLGGVYFAQQRFAAALDCYRRALRMAEELGSRDQVAREKHNIAGVHRRRKRYALAVEQYQEALAVWESMGQKADAARTLGNIALCHLLAGDAARALEVGRRGAALARKTGEREALWASLLTLGRAHRALGQTSLARQALEESAATIESLRRDVGGGERGRQPYLEDKAEPYHELAELLIEEKEIFSALRYAERTKARVLLDVLSEGKRDPAKSMSAAEREEELRLRRGLASSRARVARQEDRAEPEARLEQARRDYEAFRLGLYTKYPELKVQRGEMRELDAGELEPLLPGGGGALLEYMVTEEVTYLFVFTRPRGLAVYPVRMTRKDLSARADLFQRKLANRDLAIAAAARDLYDQLLRPARAQLAGVTRLVISPDGPLWDLPFQALQPAAGRYLLEDCAIAYVPSWTALREMNRRRAKPGGALSLLAVAGENLPNAVREVRGLETLYGARALTGADASEARWKRQASRYDVLHLATHGVLDGSRPMYSHLVLPPGGPAEDGRLEAWELMNLDLKARLAVLSSCETARGRFGEGEGILGLTWALFVAGTPATVVSQWKVDSASTTELMLDFHRRFRAGGQSAAEALRSAALEAARAGSFRHPYYWAGFVVAGAGF